MVDTCFPFSFNLTILDLLVVKQINKLTYSQKTYSTKVVYIKFRTIRFSHL